MKKEMVYAEKRLKTKTNFFLLVLNVIGRKSLYLDYSRLTLIQLKMRRPSAIGIIYVNFS